MPTLLLYSRGELSLGGSWVVQDVRLWLRCTAQRVVLIPVGVAGRVVEVMVQHGRPQGQGHPHGVGV